MLPYAYIVAYSDHHLEPYVCVCELMPQRSGMVSSRPLLRNPTDGSHELPSLRLPFHSELLVRTSECPEGEVSLDDFRQHCEPGLRGISNSCHVYS